MRRTGSRGDEDGDGERCHTFFCAHGYSFVLESLPRSSVRGELQIGNAMPKRRGGHVGRLPAMGEPNVVRSQGQAPRSLPVLALRIGLALVVLLIVGVGDGSRGRGRARAPGSSTTSPKSFIPGPARCSDQTRNGSPNE